MKITIEVPDKFEESIRFAADFAGYSVEGIAAEALAGAVAAIIVTEGNEEAESKLRRALGLRSRDGLELRLQKELIRVQPPAVETASPERASARDYVVTLKFSGIVADAIRMAAIHDEVTVEEYVARSAASSAACTVGGCGDWDGKQDEFAEMAAAENSSSAR
jgi:hypothetical protein